MSTPTGISRVFALLPPLELFDETRLVPLPDDDDDTCTNCPASVSPPVTPVTPVTPPSLAAAADAVNGSMLMSRW